MRDLSLTGSGEAIDALRGTSIIAASSNYIIDQINEWIDSDSFVEEHI